MTLEKKARELADELHIVADNIEDEDYDSAEYGLSILLDELTTLLSDVEQMYEEQQQIEEEDA